MKPIKTDVVFGDAPEPEGTQWRNMAALENELAAKLLDVPHGAVIIDKDAWVLVEQEGMLVLHHASYSEGKLVDLFSRFDHGLAFVDSDDSELLDYNNLLQRAVDDFDQHVTTEVPETEVPE